MEISDDLFARALRRVGRHVGTAASGAALVGSLGTGGTFLGACSVGDELPVDSIQEDSWSQDQGQRNTQMVSYLGNAWSECRSPNTRFGCGSYEVFVKVRVRPVAGVDLNWKRVGLTYRQPFDTYDHTAVGHYAATYANGDEEWHVPVTVTSSWATLVFDAWYQDGAGHTFVDDNQGEFHVVTTGPGQSIVRNEPWLDTVTVSDAGVRGRISVQAVDLDYDKELVLLATTDDWATVQELGMGAPGEPNKLYWTEDFAWSGSERWQIDLDLPGAGVERFRYAIGYRHGVKNGAVRYEFWDNNYGYNYLVERPVPAPPDAPDAPDAP
jgi:hypothetical protein